MKIKRFNNINENLTSVVKEFIRNFDDSTDSGIIDWVDTVSVDTNLHDYKNFTSSSRKALSFARSKNLKKLEEYFLVDKEIEIKEKEFQEEIERLRLKKENLSIIAGDELLYKFQEDLLNNNYFNKFYDFFIKDSIENSSDSNIEDIIEYSEIHPKILKKYRSKILISINTTKYNI